MRRKCGPLIGLPVNNSASNFAGAAYPVPSANRVPITTPNSLRDDVPTFGASTGSFLCNHGITLASSTVKGRALSCHIVGRASGTILLRVLVPVPLATCTFLTGYLIEYVLLMRFLAHLTGDCERQ